MTVTDFLASGAGGGVVYTASNGSDIYVDGLWMNIGTVSTSPWDPGTGFNPNAAAVPEPATTALMALGLACLVLVRHPGNS